MGQPEHKRECQDWQAWVTLYQGNQSLHPCLATPAVSWSFFLLIKCLYQPPLSPVMDGCKCCPEKRFTERGGADAAEEGNPRFFYFFKSVQIIGLTDAAGPLCVPVASVWKGRPDERSFHRGSAVLTQRLVSRRSPPVRRAAGGEVERQRGGRGRRCSLRNT